MDLDDHWKSLKLSLERPYKDDNGDQILQLLDITPDGQQIYEPKDDHNKSLGDRLLRVIAERGYDFFDKTNKQGGPLAPEDLPPIQQTQQNEAKDGDEDGNPDDGATKHMTPEELYRMRMELVPQLFITLGEMSHARDLLSSLLSNVQQQPISVAQSLLAPQVTQSTPLTSTHALAATLVTKPPPIVSVQAFNEQLAIGGKDEALRAAANVFKAAAESAERGIVKSERYWTDALKIRRANWDLSPAPLPFGAPVGKGADKTSKDFTISVGLNESPSIFRRRGMAQLANSSADAEPLIFPNRQKTRLRVSIVHISPDGIRVRSLNSIPLKEDVSLEDVLVTARREVTEQEIFSILIKEASSLPTASTRVSERLIVIDVGQGLELLFDLVQVDDFDSAPNSSSSASDLHCGYCNLIHHSLYTLLIRRHAFLKNARLTAATIPMLSPPLLQPVIDLLQYQLFCDKLRTEFGKLLQALRSAKVPASLRFDAIGSTGTDLIQAFESGQEDKLGGEAVLRIDNRYTLRFTLASPSSLIAHLPQTTLPMSSIPQLRQVLSDELEQSLLHHIREVGSELSRAVNGTWFVDLVTSRCVGRWEGCVLNFCIMFGVDFSVQCSAFRLDKSTAQQKWLENYPSSSAGDMALSAWVEGVIKQATGRHS